MSDETRLDELLSLWQGEQARGQDVPATELCRDCPELLPEVECRLNALRQMHQMAATTDGLGDGHRAMVATVAPPQTLGGYEIVGELGRGGMGVVYKARQVALKRLVALKMVLGGGHAGAGQLGRFRAEAEVVARLKHPHIVEIHDIGEADGLPFFALEYVEGGSLAQKLAGTPLPPVQAAALIGTLARAMQYAHEHGVVHRDLKPANVLLSADGRPKVTDFGLAKQLDSGVHTASGAVVGTPSYMAPEQAAGKSSALGPPCDIYALGALLYECVTGRPPFRAATVVETLQQVVRDEPVPPRQLNAQVARDLETICLKCLRKEPEKRYRSALELAEDLDRFGKGEPVRARPAGRLERAWRWCRRNTAVAASLFAVAVILLSATVVSTIFGFRAEDARRAEAEHARNEANAKREAEVRAASEKVAKQEADQARGEAQQQLVDLCGASGSSAARDGDHALALLWFARAVHLAKDDPRQQALNRIRMANWLRQVCLPEGSFTVPGIRPNQERFRQFQFSPDGNYLLIVVSTGDCLVWDRLRGRLVSLPESAAKGTAAAWPPRSALLAVAEKTGVIRFLAAPDFKEVDRVAAGADVSTLEFSRDGERLAWGGSDGARVWDRAKKEYITPLLPHGGQVLSCAFSSTGERLATSSSDDKAQVFRVPCDGPEPVFPPVPHRGNDGLHAHRGPEPVSPRFAAGDQVLLTVEEPILKWRSAVTGRLLSSKGSTENVECAAFAVSERGQQVAVLGGTKGHLFDARNRQVLSPIPAAPPWNWNEHVIFSADGQTLVTCGHDTRARFWSVHDQSGDMLFEAHPSVYHPMQAVRVSLSANGRHLATALWDGTICLWRLPAGAPIAYTAAPGGMTLPALTPDKRFVMARGLTYRNGARLQTRVYDAQTGKPAGPRLDPGGILLDAAFSPDAGVVVTASSTGRTPAERNQRLFEPDGKGGNVQIWDWKTGKRLVGPIPMPTEPRGLAFRPDGRTLAVVCADYQVVLVEPKTGTITHRLDPGLRTRPNNANQWFSNGEARFSADGRFLVTWEMTPHVHVWDPDRGQLLRTLPHTERVNKVAFHPTCPDLLATVGWASDARIWNLSTGKLVNPLKHPQWVAPLQFAPGGNDLITGADDGLLRVWDWQAGKVRDGWALHASALRDFGFTADHRWLTSLGEFELQVTDWRTKTPVTPRWNVKPNANLALAIPAGDRRVIVGGFGSALVAYDLETMLTPVTGRAADLVDLAELLAGRRILSQGNVVPLNSAEWAERWDRVRRHGEAGVGGYKKILDVDPNDERA